jgi:O-antigen/teichoic acid export membrane protein
MSNAAKYRKEIAWALAAKASAFLFYYALVYYLTHLMTVRIWGEWSAFFAVLSLILLLSDQGINIASKRFIAQARGTPELGGVVRRTLFLRVVASAIYTALIFFLLNFVPLSGQAYDAGLFEHSLVLIGLYSVLDYLKNLFEALHRLRFTFVITAVEHSLKLLLVILLLREQSQFNAIITGFTIATAAGIVAGGISLFRMVPGVFSGAAPPKLTRQAYIYSLPIFLMSIGGLVALEIDTIMLRQMRNAYETGIYAAAKNIVIFLPHLSLAFSMGTMPRLAIFNSTTAGANRRTYYRLLLGITGLYLLISLGVVAFAFFGVRLFYGESYGAATVPLLALTPFVLLTGVSTFCASFLDYRGLAWMRSFNFMITLVVNVVLNWLWIPRWGAVGAAAASTMAFLPYCLLNIWQAHNAFSPRRPGGEADLVRVDDL